jgi:hypothetical protein
MSVFGRWFTAASGPSETAASPPAAPAEREASASAPTAAASTSTPASAATPAAAPAQSASAEHHHGGVQPVQVEHGYDSPEPDLYRTFSPSEVAFWDLKAPADGQSGSGFFARFFGGSGGGGASGGSK